MKINIHDQIYAWREVMEEKHQIQFVKKEAMRVADKVLSSPQLYRIATSTAETALDTLPRFAVYNSLNTWGKHRELPHSVEQTFHEWYRKNRTVADGKEN